MGTAGNLITNHIPLILAPPSGITFQIYYSVPQWGMFKIGRGGGLTIRAREFMRMVKWCSFKES